MAVPKKQRRPTAFEQHAHALAVLEGYRDRLQTGSAESEEELLAQHEELREILEPMLTGEEGLRATLSTDASGPASPAAEPASPTAEPAGSRREFGPYEIQRPLGHGGMGAVYLARHRDLDRQVALKLILPERMYTATARRRFWREAKAVSKLEHPGICPVYEVGEEDGTPFMAMQYLEGEALSERIDRAVASTSEGLPPKTRGGLNAVVELVEKVARALQVAHEHEVVHRDIKPNNILLRPSGEPVLLDFGLALDATEHGEGTCNGADQVSRLTSEGDVMGTPGYMAPEQIEGRVEVIGPRTDVYALGVVLYELLTLRQPFRAASAAALFAAILHDEPEAPRRLNPAIPRDLEAVCLKAMEKDLGQRYPTAAEFAADLCRFRTLRPTMARPPSTIGRILRTVRRRPAAAAAALLIAVLAGLFVAGRIQQHQERAFADLVARAFLDFAAISDTEKDALREHLTPQQFDLLSRDARSPAAQQVLVRLLTTGTRAPQDQYRLLEPGHVVASPRPFFRFEVPAFMEGPVHYRLDLSGPDGPRSFAITQPPDHRGGALAWQVPEALPPGDYTWHVEIDPAQHTPATCAAFETEPKRFRLANPSELTRIRESAPKFGKPSLDRYWEAHALLHAGFGREALALLADLPAPLRNEAPLRWSYLRLWGLALTQQDDRFKNLLLELPDPDPR